MLAVHTLRLLAAGPPISAASIPIPTPIAIATATAAGSIPTAAISIAPASIATAAIARSPARPSAITASIGAAITFVTGRRLGRPAFDQRDEALAAPHADDVDRAGELPDLDLLRVDAEVRRGHGNRLFSRCCKELFLVHAP